MSLTPPPLRSGSVPARGFSHGGHGGSEAAPPTPPSRKCVPAIALALLTFVIASHAGRARADEIIFAPETGSDARTAGGGWAGIERAVSEKCAAGDAGLTNMAREILARRRAESRVSDAEAVAFAQRTAGEPHPWPKVWVASARVLAPYPTLQKFDAWLTELGQSSLRRCGVAGGVSSDGGEVIVAVVVDALADLAPLSRRVRTGQWLSVAAHLRVHAEGGKVIVLGPSGAPQPLPTSFDGKTLRAWFAPDGPGEFTVQAVADFASGPRPVLEAHVFSDIEPPVLPNSDMAPGEDETRDEQDEERAVARMLTSARAWAGLPALARDGRLDAVARDHAVRIARAQRLAHNVGDGDPGERLRAIGLETHEIGENLATAPNVILAHRAIWASPSHRANVLSRNFERVGLGVAHDSRGDIWVVEAFASAF